MEGKSGLYVFFKTVCDMYHLIPEDGYTIPPEAEGIDTSEDSPDEAYPPADEFSRGGGALGEVDNLPSTPGLPLGSHTGATARRQRHGHSRASSVVTTVVEENEEDEDDDDSSQITEMPTTHPTGTQVREGRYEGTIVASVGEDTGGAEPFPEVGDAEEEEEEEEEGYDEPETAPSQHSNDMEESEIEPFPGADSPESVVGVTKSEGE